MKILFSFLIGYLLGSFPAAYIITKLKTGQDIREIGTKNMGTGNVFHHVGKVEGLIVLFIDVLKGSLAVIIAIYGFKLPYYIGALSGLFAVLGHVFPIFLNFKGGRGAATTLGVHLTVLFSYLKLDGFYVFIPILIIYLILILVSKSQVVSLFFLYPVYPILLFVFTKDFKLLIVNIIFTVLVEFFGFLNFKREFDRVISMKRSS
ncbi:MAG: glycerol-3-phosphate acyltransferase [Caldisericum sp.]|jgi:glycerol-3-phosphate acyltransferase PlsY|nr:glycerol-3-phosphate acyltransferase [Caldisericum sp.]